MDVFDECSEINDLIFDGSINQARDRLIVLLDFHKKQNILYTPIVNHLARELGLFPYIDPETSLWQDRYIYEAFKVDIGLKYPVTLHSEQSQVLKHLIDGQDLAISAPTSFGKSLIIDAYIAIKNPDNVLIIVPTIALADETRRRLHKKFANDYKIITTADVELSKKNIFIFPQERAIGYFKTIKELDLLVVDEFYKASKDLDKKGSSRPPALLKAIIKLGKISKQKYYLAPNISSIKENPFTNNMPFLPLNFNTVFLKKYEYFRDIENNIASKKHYLTQILKNNNKSKSLIYAGSYPNVNEVADILIDNIEASDSELLLNFSEWLGENYTANWNLIELVKKGTGIHTGQLHRSLSQIQVKLFEEEKLGLQNIISTSSIIEGVNTSAENVVVWSNKNGNLLLTDFSYRNVIGRAGRMFKHFVGHIYILESPPIEKNNQLELSFPDELLADIDEKEFKQELTKEQIVKIIKFKEDMLQILGEGTLARLQREDNLISSDMVLIERIVLDINENKNQWRGLKLLHSNKQDDWDWILHKILALTPGKWEIPHNAFINFIKLLSQNWTKSIPELLNELDDIDINMFFKLERVATYKLTTLLNDINVIQKEILKENSTDISSFIANLSWSFMPPCIIKLEEYGLPRMISKKIQISKIINFETDATLHNTIELLIKEKGSIYNEVEGLGHFDRYILDYFFDGIENLTIQRIVEN